MTTVTFLSSSGQRLAVVEAEPGSNLLQLARDHDIPLHWRCGQGTCGTCRVHVLHALQPRTVLLARKERNVLVREGLSADTGPDDVLRLDSPQQWRLACHLTIGNEDWRVVLP